MRFLIQSRDLLQPAIERIVVEAPLAARKAKAGQFVILRAGGESERIPLTLSDWDAGRGTVTLIYQIVGAATRELASVPAGGALADLVGPLGRPSALDGISSAAVICGGVGAAAAYPVAKALASAGASVDTVLGFRSAPFLLLVRELREISRRSCLMTDDGSAGRKGVVTDRLGELLRAGERYDTVLAFGPIPMMAAVSRLTESYGVPCTVSMNPIMIDGTGMCGCCRLTVGGEIRFACTDGPEFDGHLVDFQEVLSRNRLYHAQERRAREAGCNLLKEADRFVGDE